MSESIPQNHLPVRVVKTTIPHRGMSSSKKAYVEALLDQLEPNMAVKMVFNDFEALHNLRSAFYTHTTTPNERHYGKRLNTVRHGMELTIWWKDTVPNNPPVVIDPPDNFSYAQYTEGQGTAINWEGFGVVMDHLGSSND